MRLPFELDPQIIHHIIYSQAGSIGKAVIELVMNSVDANASAVRLTLTKEGFRCADDGNGFASREDVLRYFGRFGTPHQDGDATYGRFRLGRGQIMAHAKTEWFSNHWLMSVDTRAMGYNYELEDLQAPATGCSISGTWYEALSDLELISAVQEIRDLVRYTPISVELNGRVITRNPANEKWDFEDEWAYYRAKEDGPVSIYNQGVLIRHDSSHVWGAGGLIVSKRAINLNVSRTEILRKTCPVWKPIAKEFKRLADAVSARLGDHRKTEARREKSARSLLSGDENICDVYIKEEVITLLPGKRHVTLMDFRLKAFNWHKGTYTLIEHGNDIPKGEAIAREGLIQIVHPKTLERFGCHNYIDFEEALERALCNVSEAAQAIENRGERAPYFWRSGTVLDAPVLAAYSTFRDAFIERTQIIDERTSLDKETRRAWTALRWCLQHYAGACIGAERYTDGTLRWDEKRLQILLGESNTAEAWTDGLTYLAISCDVVKRISSKPLEAVAYIFGLVEHEVAHQGDSIACGHDEAFYQRYHDISIRMAPERQRFMHKWLMKYTMSMERDGQKTRGRVWSERWLIDRVGNGRIKRGLSPVIEDVSANPIVTEIVPDQNMALLSVINASLVDSGACPAPPNWEAVREQALRDQGALAEIEREAHEDQKKQDAEFSLYIDSLYEDAAAEVVKILALDSAEIPAEALNYLAAAIVNYGFSADDVKIAWGQKDWVKQHHPGEYYHEDFDATDPENHELEAAIEAAMQDEFEREMGEEKPIAGELWRVDEDCRPLVKDGEAFWQLERNAAAAGFRTVESYLKWRHDQLAD
ncbi:ATP-binding protein [Pseudomonas kitaguniensis]|uniref:ATP-binding protein n=1 Tax=Pseudomonas kitaguniensis TaxID=2607908 RepID=UPI003BA3D57C